MTRTPAKPRRHSQPNTPPEVVEITIERLAGMGDGVANWKGRPLYVPYAAPGDRVRLRASSTAKGWRGELLELLSAGPDRQPAPCAHFGECGGCRLQHLKPGAYGEFKQQQLTGALQRESIQLEPGVLQPLVQIPVSSRRRVELAIGPEGSLGFRAASSHRLVPITQCHVLHPELDRAIQAWQGKPWPWATSVHLTWDPAFGIDACLRGESPLTPKQTAHWIEQARQWGWARVHWQAGQGEPELLAAFQEIFLPLPGGDVPLPPGSFLQASAAAQKWMIAEVQAACGKARKLADLYCGIGTYALPLSQRANVWALEENPQAVEALSRAARANRRPIRAEVRDLTARPLVGAELTGLDAAIVNPPRAGAAEQCRLLAMSAIPTIVMVSCNPTTFARDAKALLEGGYKLERLTPLDQFTWSAHLEVIGVFRKRSN